MICPRCKEMKEDTVKMKDIKRKGGFHKQTKYICPDCGFKKMIKNK